MGLIKLIQLSYKFACLSAIAGMALAIFQPAGYIWYASSMCLLAIVCYLNGLEGEALLKRMIDLLAIAEMAIKEKEKTNETRY